MVDKAKDNETIFKDEISNQIFITSLLSDKLRNTIVLFENKNYWEGKRESTRKSGEMAQRIGIQELLSSSQAPHGPR